MRPHGYRPGTRVEARVPWAGDQGRIIDIHQDLVDEIEQKHAPDDTVGVIIRGVCFLAREFCFLKYHWAEWLIGSIPVGLPAAESGFFEYVLDIMEIGFILVININVQGTCIFSKFMYKLEL
ncbi:Os12g0570600 [Oryza sativa Japonica Group]|uniref:Os12g0570600 protein n=1 Tax=Oryza sativa subsp. japonica TaxID=39947 RepID=A0A0P0YBN6_ORYSJ|nr:hypothetical protein EE612_060391 [Oryza sativa]BAT17736.1 Os12g0570600 [Oryza sativa Japonica Group]